jgi:hypothetical protein
MQRMIRTLEPGRRSRVIARAVEDARVVRIWRRLEAAGLHPILIKGWSTARLYADPDERWLGDIDLCFPPDELSQALALKRESPREFTNTDYHDGVPDLPDRTWEEILGRTQLIETSGATIRVLALEDHLRLTCRHWARHGGRLRRMLEDVAAIVNALPEDFNWDECLRGDAQDTRWVLAVVGLAARLLDAEVKDSGIRERAVCPDWLAEIVPHIWNAGRDKRPLSYYLQHPREGQIALQYRWLNPIRAAFYTKTLPRTHTQMSLTVLRYFCFCRTSTLVSHPLRRLLRGGGFEPRAEVHQNLIR